MNSCLRQKKAMTLLELVVVIGFLSVIVLVLGQFVSSSLKNYRNNTLAIEFEENIARIIREFEYSARAGINIESATDNEFIFYRFYDSTAINPTRIRYFANNGQFMVGKIEPDFNTETGVLSYPFDQEEITLIIDNLENPDSQIFTYYSMLGEVIDESQTALVNIRSMEISVTLGGHPTDPNKKISQSTTVTFRNLDVN